MLTTFLLLPLFGLLLGLMLRPRLGGWGVRLALFLHRFPNVAAEVQRESFRQVLQRGDVTVAVLERELKATTSLLERASAHERTRSWSHLQALESHRAQLAQALCELRSSPR